MHGDIEKMTDTAALPNDQAGISRGFTVDQNFSGADGTYFSDVAEPHCHPDDRACEVDHSGFADADRELAGRVLVRGFRGLLGLGPKCRAGKSCN
jgi:hypothetical protein